MPIDINKIAPDRKLAVIDGILRGIQNMKREEEARREAELKALLEQAKIQSLEQYRQRMANVAEQGVLLKGEELGLRQQQVESDINYKQAQLDLAYERLKNDIRQGNLDEAKFINQVLSSSPEYISLVEQAKSAAKLPQEMKLKEYESLLDQAKNIKQHELDIALENVKQLGRERITQMEVSGRKDIATMQEEGAWERTQAQLGTRISIAKLQAETDLMIAEMRNQNAKEVEAMKTELGETPSERNKAVEEYTSKLAKYNDEISRFLASKKGKLENIQDDDAKYLKSLSDEIVNYYSAMKEKYGDSIVIPRPNLLLQIETKKGWFGRKKEVLSGFSSDEVTEYNTIMSFRDTIKDYKEKDARKILLDKGYSPNVVDKALKDIYGK